MAHVDRGDEVADVRGIERATEQSDSQAARGESLRRPRQEHSHAGGVTCDLLDETGIDTGST